MVPLNVLYDLTRAQRLEMPGRLQAVFDTLSDTEWREAVAERGEDGFDEYYALPRHVPDWGDARKGLICVFDWIGRAKRLAGVGVSEWTIRVVPGFVYPTPRRLVVLEIRGWGWNTWTTNIRWGVDEPTPLSVGWGRVEEIYDTVVEARVSFDKRPARVESPGCRHPEDELRVGVRWSEWDGDPDQLSLCGDVRWDRAYTESWWTSRDADYARRRRAAKVEMFGSGLEAFGEPVLVVWDSVSGDWDESAKLNNPSTCPAPIWRETRMGNQDDQWYGSDRHRARGPPNDACPL